MRSSLRKLRGLGLHHRSEAKERREQLPAAKLDEPVQAAQDMQDMRSCYDGLLSAAAATANSAYEFSEALHEMGTCLLEKTAQSDDENIGQVLLMLGKAQFGLQKLVDNYRAHIIQTITTPSECLLRELQIVEDMKQQCEAKRDLYKFMLTAPRAKGRSRNTGETFTHQQLLAAREDYEEEANLFVFRLKSLKQGQSRSLLTQAARHHAAQLNFFRKGLKSLELIEPHVKDISEQQHIDYHFNELEDDDTDGNDDGCLSCDSSDDGELSFDYALNEHAEDALSVHHNSMEIDQVDDITIRAAPFDISQDNLHKTHVELLYRNQISNLGSQSAPILADGNFNMPDNTKEALPSSKRKFYSYVLPTPMDVKNAASTTTNLPFSFGQPATSVVLPTQLWHSSPLEPRNLMDFRQNGIQSATENQKQQTTLEYSNISSNPIKTSAPSQNFTTFSSPDSQRFKRYAFSGPITGKSWSGKPFLTSHGIPKIEDPAVFSKFSHTSVPIKVSSSTSPPTSSAPRISELHELPRPPIPSAQSVAPSSSVGHSAPLVSRGQESRMPTKPFSVASKTASPLPAPPTVLRSFSIPYRGQRTPLGTLNKLLEAPQVSEEVDSPPLTPLSLKIFHTESPSSTLLQR
ncbi:Uncharacterized protein AXF42_Ash009570 [Apostasia shenzhenica]|uniref:BAR domain-containing protein n=1 Tax=Apostasia shenzhenica TaxID=1088818 RepID=A0A2I0B966_9ASPA|nr:Uncharacterized protein AXF42_Ash009570 [Apostasia shenzhenica]